MFKNKNITNRRGEIRFEYYQKNISELNFK